MGAFIFTVQPNWEPPRCPATGHRVVNAVGVMRWDITQQREEGRTQYGAGAFHGHDIE